MLSQERLQQQPFGSVIAGARFMVISLRTVFAFYHGCCRHGSCFLWDGIIGGRPDPVLGSVCLSRLKPCCLFRPRVPLFLLRFVACSGGINRGCSTMSEYTVISEISAAKVSDDADLEKVGVLQYRFPSYLFEFLKPFAGFSFSCVPAHHV